MSKKTKAQIPNRSVGRPSDLTPELIDLTNKYLIESLADTTKYPSIAELALELHISRETAHAWKRDKNTNELKKQFSDIIDDILGLQELRLSQNGLKGSYNSTIAKLMLTKHGYTDKQDITSGDEPVQPVLVRFIGDEEQGKDN